MNILDNFELIDDLSPEEVVEEKDETQSLFTNDAPYLPELQGDEEEEEAQTDLEDSNDVDNISDIPFAQFTKSWKTAGLLSDSFTLPDKTDISSFKEAIFNDIYTPLKEAAQAQAEEELEQARRDKGLHIIEVAEKIMNGVSPTTIADGVIIDGLISLDIDSDTDEAIANREKLIRTMHQLNGLTPKRIDKLVEISQNDDEDLADAKEAKDYLKKIKQEKEQQEIVANKRKQDEQELAINNFYSMIKDTIDKGLIANGVNKDKFYKDITEPSVYVDVYNGDNTVKRKFTKFQEAQKNMGVIITPTNEAVASKNIIPYLETVHKLLYGAVTESDLKKKIKKEVEDELDGFLRKKPNIKSKVDYIITD